MRIGFLLCNKFHETILRPIHETLRHQHWCLYTANREALFDFQPHVVIMAEAIFGELRPRLPKTVFIHTRHGLASKKVSYQGANECDYLCVTSEFIRDWYQEGRRQATARLLGHRLRGFGSSLSRGQPGITISRGNPGRKSSCMRRHSTVPSLRRRCWAIASSN